ncbi:MAG: methionyl-tRNA formyltransferase [Dehalococcoidia bacterium]
MRVFYVGSDRYLGCAQSILESGHTIAGLHANGPGHQRVGDLARRLAVPWTTGRIPPATFQALRADGVDLFFTAGFGHRVPIEADPELRAVNFHPMLLPEGRGPDPYPWVILEGRPETGITLHEMTPRLDDGPILLQRAIPVHERETAVTLALRSAIAAREATSELFAGFERYWANRRPQAGGSYWKALTALAREVDWALPVFDVDRRLRAHAAAGAWTVIWGRRAELQPVACWTERHAHPAGTIISEQHAVTLVAASGGYLAVQIKHGPPPLRRLAGGARWRFAQLKAATRPRG